MAPFYGWDSTASTESLQGGTLLFTTKLPSILSFPQKVAPDYFSILKY